MYRFILALLLTTTTFAQIKTFDEATAKRVANNWLNYILITQGDWNLAENPKLDEVTEIIEQDKLIGYLFSIEPTGNILVPVYNALAPIYYYDTKYDNNKPIKEEYLDVLTFKLISRHKTINELLQKNSDDDIIKNAINKNEPIWNLLNTPENEFESILPPATRGNTVGPLLSTQWHQSTPYNNYSPSNSCGKTLAGCVAIATAQIMKYWNHPSSGNGNHTYYYYGDPGCNNEGAGYLTADFSDSYDWGNMLNNYNGSYTKAQSMAVAELCYEVAVSVNMEFGVSGSSASPMTPKTILPQYFNYSNSISHEARALHSDQAWFDIIQQEIDNSRPMLYIIFLPPGYGAGTHELVCDGYAESISIQQIHLNYGWGGTTDGWYSLDEIPLAVDEYDVLIKNIYPGTELFKQNIENSLNETSSFNLKQNHPNPFNPSTQIAYQIAKEGYVNLVIYNALGQEIVELVNKHQASGSYSVEFNASDLPSGVYFYKIESGNFTKVNKMLLLR